MSSAPAVTIVRNERISSSEALQFGVDFLARNKGFAIIGCLLVFISAQIPGLGFWFVTAPLLIGFFKAIRTEQLTGKQPSIGDLFAGYGMFVPALVIGFWGSAMTLVGLIFCCVPGLCLLPVPFFGFVAVARDGQGGIRALTRAIRIVEKDPLGLFVACILLFVVGLSGMMLCYIGAAITLPVMLAGLYRVGDQMLETEPG